MLRRVALLSAAVAAMSYLPVWAGESAPRVASGTAYGPPMVHAPWPEVAVIGYPNYYTFGTSAGYPNAFTFGGTRAVPVVARGVKTTGGTPISVSDLQATNRGPQIIRVLDEAPRRPANGPKVIRRSDY